MINKNNNQNKMRWNNSATRPRTVKLRGIDAVAEAREKVARLKE
jgi:hypothetical protein